MKRRDGDREIAAFAKALTEILGHKNWPPAVAGDLSDLLGTLEQGVVFLRDLMNTSNREEIPGMLLRLELLIADDLARYERDLLPALRRICQEAYTAIGEEDDFSDDERVSP
jgi:hypothetical protein